MPERQQEPMSAAAETRDMPPPVARSIADLRAGLRVWRDEGRSIGLVPTMGALHDGHLTLVREMARQCDRVVVTLFVNPLQFGPGEDFEAYPRQEDADRAALAGSGADLLFAPSTGEMYPQGFATRLRVLGLADELEGAHRPGHFEGVATVVAKLLIQAAPDAAIFGEKDYQQLAIIRRLVRDLDLPVRVLAIPIAREADGLAASSRNAYLDARERAIAPALYRALTDLAERARAGERLALLEAAGRRALARAGFSRVDYLTFRDAGSLAPLARLDRPARLLAAARLGRTRLLDNIAVAPEG